MVSRGSAKAMWALKESEGSITIEVLGDGVGEIAIEPRRSRLPPPLPGRQRSAGCRHNVVELDDVEITEV